MTPEQARKLLDGITPPPWEIESSTYQEAGGPEITEFWATGRYDVQIAEQDATGDHRETTEKDFNLIAAAPDMANMIAGMSPEYAVQGKAPNSDEWLTLSQWSEELPSSEFELEITLTDEDTGETHRIDARIAARYVTEPQPLGEEQ